MPYNDQVENFRINTKFWYIMGIWPKAAASKYYKYYTICFVLIFNILYGALTTTNFFYMPRQVDAYIGDMIFYFTELSATSKILTFCYNHHQIEEIFESLRKDVFQPENDKENQIINQAKTFNRRYYNTVMVVSLISHLTHIFTPLILHIFLPVPLELPVCSYSFIPEHIIAKFVYILYLYQCLGMHTVVWYNVNIDSFFLGIIILMIAQLDILDKRLRELTGAESAPKVSNIETNKDKRFILRMKKCIIHFEEISRFCSLIQRTFCVTLFVQFSVASAIICICSFRFTMPAPVSYFIFLTTYMFIMTIQILVPCWFGTRIIDKSEMLSKAVYSCDWTGQSRTFKTNMRLFVERTKRPLTIIGWKMFPVSLTTFTSIINTAYSFFTLLRHMQSSQ